VAVRFHSGLLRRPFNPLHRTIEHEIKHVVAFFFEDNTVVAVRQMGMQDLFDCRLNLALGL